MKITLRPLSSRRSILVAVLLSAVLLQAPSARAQSSVVTSDLDIKQKLGARVSMDLPLFDEKGRTITLGQAMNGKPTILALVFYRCAGVCPLTMNSLGGLMDDMELKAGEDYQSLSVSFAPEEDWRLAIDQKRNYMAAFQKPLDPEAWLFLTSPADSVNTLTEQVGFPFVKTGGGYAHPGALIILSPQGKVCRYVMGSVDYDPTDIKIAIGKAAKEEVMSERYGSASRSLLAKCFGYDPQNGAAPLVFRIIGILTVFSILIFVTFMFLARKKEESSGAEESKQ